jgi:hypothetical protein
MPNERGRTGLSENHLRQINFSTQILCYTFVTAFVILRLSLQRKLGKPFSIDDVTCVLAWLLFMGYCTCCLLYGFAGGANKEINLTDQEIENSFRVSYASTLIYAPLALAVKVTLLLVLRKIYRPCRLGCIAIHSILALNVLYYTIILFVKAFVCVPASAYWTSLGQPTDQCLNRFAVIVADSVISVVSDMAILVLPIILTWPLQMAVCLKAKVMALLGFGGLAVGFSLYRLVLVISTRNSPDQTIVFMKVLLSGNAEGAIGLICTCLPSLSRYISRRKRHERIPSPEAIENHPFPIFDGSQICSADGSLRSQVQTRIWRSRSDSQGIDQMMHDIEATTNRSSSIGIRKDVTFHQQDNQEAPATQSLQDLIKVCRFGNCKRAQGS